MTATEVDRRLQVQVETEVEVDTVAAHYLHKMYYNSNTTLNPTPPE